MRAPCKTEVLKSWKIAYFEKVRKKGSFSNYTFTIIVYSLSSLHKIFLRYPTMGSNMFFNHCCPLFENYWRSYENLIFVPFFVLSITNFFKSFQIRRGIKYYAKNYVFEMANSCFLTLIIGLVCLNKFWGHLGRSLMMHPSRSKLCPLRNTNIFV